MCFNVKVIQRLNLAKDGKYINVNDNYGEVREPINGFPQLPTQFSRSSMMVIARMIAIPMKLKG